MCFDDFQSELNERIERFLGFLIRKQLYIIRTMMDSVSECEVYTNVRDYSLSIHFGIHRERFHNLQP
jgi:hypothetical protein